MREILIISYSDPSSLEERLRGSGARFSKRKGGGFTVAADEPGTETLSAAAAKVIVSDLKPTEMRRLVGLLPVSAPEAKLILPEAIRLTDDVSDEIFVRRKAAEYFQRNDMLILEGFLHFRLGELLEAWALAADRAAGRVLFDRQYVDLMRLLEVASRAERDLPLHNEVCLLLHFDGSCIICDGSGCRIECAHIDRACILAMLSTLAPDAVTVYDLTQGRANELIKCIRELFGKGVVIFSSVIK